MWGKCFPVTQAITTTAVNTLAWVNTLQPAWTWVGVFSVHYSLTLCFSTHLAPKPNCPNHVDSMPKPCQTFTQSLPNFTQAYSRQICVANLSPLFLIWLCFHTFVQHLITTLYLWAAVTDISYFRLLKLRITCSNKGVNITELAVSSIALPFRLIKCSKDF